MNRTTYLVIVFIIFTHWVSDFVLQSDAMAKNKSKSNKWLSVHVFVYSIPFLFLGWEFALVNGIAHFAVDWFTSRLTSRLWAEGRVHDFFVVIGFDQAVHMITLISSADWFGLL